MIWNYRIVRIVENGEERYEVGEVYYDADKRPWSYCEFNISAESADDCRKIIEWILTGSKKPVLNYPDDFNGVITDDSQAKNSNSNAQEGE